MCSSLRADCSLPVCFFFQAEGGIRDVAVTGVQTCALPICDLFRLMTAGQKQQLFQNYKAAMEGVPVEIVRRQIVHCYRADPEYGAGVAKAMGINFTPQMIAAE